MKTSYTSREIDDFLSAEIVRERDRWMDQPVYLPGDRLGCVTSLWWAHGSRDSVRIVPVLMARVQTQTSQTEAVEIDCLKLAATYPPCADQVKPRRERL